MRLISWGRRATLSLEDIRELLDEYDTADQGRAQLSKALGKLRQKAEELDAQRTHLSGEIERLEALSAHMDAEADRT